MTAGVGVLHNCGSDVYLRGPICMDGSARDQFGGVPRVLVL